MRKMKSNTHFLSKTTTKKEEVTASEQGNAQALEVAEQPTHTLMDG